MRPKPRPSQIYLRLRQNREVLKQCLETHISRLRLHACSHQHLTCFTKCEICVLFHWKCGTLLIRVSCRLQLILICTFLPQICRAVTVPLIPFPVRFDSVRFSNKNRVFSSGLKTVNSPTDLVCELHMTWAAFCQFCSVFILEFWSYGWEELTAPRWVRNQ